MGCLGGALGFPGGSVVKKNPPANAGGAGSIPGSGGSHGEGNGNPLQYSCLQNPMGRDLVGYSSWGHKESDTTERLTHTLLPDGPVNKYGLIKVSIRTFAGNSRAKSFLLCDYQHSAMGTRQPWVSIWEFQPFNQVCH